MTPRTARITADGKIPDNGAASHVVSHHKATPVFIGETGLSNGVLQQGVQPTTTTGVKQDPLTGRFLPGNLAAALRSDRLPPEFEHLRQELQDFMADCLSDEGDEGEVSRRRRSLLEYRARLHRRIQQLDTALEQRGLFDKSGKLRMSWLQRLEGLIDRCRALDSLLGLKRQQKRVPALADVMRGEAEL